MTTNKRRRCIVATTAVACLIIAACGTRLDQETLANAAQGTGVSAQYGEQIPGETMPGQGGMPGELAPGETAGPALGADSGVGQNGTAGQAGRADGQPERNDANQRRAQGGTGGTAAGEPIVIGSVGYYSGPVGAAYQQTLRAVRAWAAEINANGGIDGRPIKFIARDTQGDGAKARSHARELVEEQGAVALVTNMLASANVGTFTKIVAELQVPAIGGNCGGDAWTNSPMVFNQCPSFDGWVQGVARLGAIHGTGDKLAVLYCVEGAGCTEPHRRLVDEGYAKRAGLDPVYSARISLTQPDFTSECIQARNAGAELMNVWADPHTTERVAASCQRQGYSPQFLQSGNMVNAGSVTKPGLGNALLASPSFPFAGLSTPAFKEFRTTLQRRGIQDPGGNDSLGWAAVKIFEHAARGAKGNISSKALLTQLYQMKNERFGGLTVPLSYSKSGTAETKCIFFMRGQNGKWTAPNGDKPTCW